MLENNEEYETPLTEPDNNQSQSKFKGFINEYDKPIEFIAKALGVVILILSIAYGMLTKYFSVMAGIYYNIPEYYFEELSYTNMVDFVINVIVSIPPFLYIYYMMNKYGVQDRSIPKNCEDVKVRCGKLQTKWIKKYKISIIITRRIFEALLGGIIAIIVYLIFYKNISIVYLIFYKNISIVCPYLNDISSSHFLGKYIDIIFSVVLLIYVLGVIFITKKFFVDVGILFTLIFILCNILIAFIILIAPEYNKNYEYVEIENGKDRETTIVCKDLCKNEKENRLTECSPADTEVKKMLILTEYHGKFLVVEYSEPKEELKAGNKEEISENKEKTLDLNCKASKNVATVSEDKEITSKCKQVTSEEPISEQSKNEVEKKKFKILTSKGYKLINKENLTVHKLVIRKDWDVAVE